MPTFLKKLKVGQRIYALMAVTLVFLLTIGGIGYYKMNQIGYELVGIAERDIPLTEILTKITVHQLEQAILLEQALRYSGVDAHDEDHTVDGTIKHFKELAHKTDSEIIEAEHMAERFITEARDPVAIKEFKHVLAQLKTIEEHHKSYEDHAFSLFERIEKAPAKNHGSYGNAPNHTVHTVEPHAGGGGGQHSAPAHNGAAFGEGSIANDVLIVESEQSKLDHEIEELLFEVEHFTKDAAKKALHSEEVGKMLILISSLIITIVASILSFFLGRGVTKPISDLTSVVESMAAGNLEVDPPVLPFEDEIYDMAQATEVFRQDMIKARELEGVQKIERAKRQRQQEELNQLTGIFGSTIGAVFGKILEASKMMVERSEAMKSDSNQTKEMATGVAKEAEESSSNAHSLSAAMEEMVASVQEISQQVSKSSEVTRQAVDAAGNSQQEVEALQGIADEIGNVVQLITDIAEQTNLLALNATIEAARAGDAGKGFAVVASEVKNLASETAKATEEISAKINNIQDASRSSAQSIASIGTIIQEVDQYVSAIVAAVEEQNATTQEMSRNVSFVAQSSSRVSENIVSITSQADNVGKSSEEVSGSANEMSEDAEVLSKEVETFLGAMQNTDVNDNKFEARHVSLSATGQVNGGTWSGNISEISTAYATISPAMNYGAGEKVSITIDGIAMPLDARIAKNENGLTTLQFPLDLDHISKMREEIEKIA